MPRQARQPSKTDIYHLLVRGNNRGSLFYDDEDRQRYLVTLARITSENCATVLGYCLMDNHVHLLIKASLDKISNLMHRLGVSYAYYFNMKYEHTGHVFQNRYKSENVEDDIYLKTVIRYIHHNPVKAGLAVRSDAYPWSSCQVYCGGKEYGPELTNTGFILSLFSDQYEQALMVFRDFCENECSDDCLDNPEKNILSDIQARQIIAKVMQERSISALTGISKTDRNMLLHQLKLVDGLSIRQISRLTGVSFNIVKRA